MKPSEYLFQKKGWGKRLLDLQDSDGRWGGGMYGPKWISTTYTMLTLRLLGLPPNNPQAKRACKLFLDKGFYIDGGINFFFIRLETQRDLRYRDDPRFAVILPPSR